MYLANRTVLITGIVLIGLAVCLVANVALSAQTGDKDPFDEDEAAEFLQDVNDNEGVWIGSFAVGMVSDAGLLVLAAALLYTLFRDRSRILGLITLTGLVAGSAIAAMTDITGILTASFADDFVNGGGPVAAGDPAAFEAGRALAMLTFAGFQASGTAIGIAFIALGMLTAYAPQGAINPPRWLGWPAMIAGLAFILSWLVIVAEPFFIFFPIGGIGVLLYSIVVGAWLIRHRDLQPA